MKIYILFIVSLHFLCNCFSQNTETRYYQAGFKTYKLIDSARIYKPGTPESHPLHYRPVELDVWYPSTKKTSERLFFKDLFGLLEERAVKYQDNDDYSGLMEELALFFAIEMGLTVESGKKLLDVETDSYENAPPAQDKFPLIIYMAGFNGMGFENFKILENLAKNGYVVVSVWSMGRYPGNMTNEKEDMLAQVYDAEFALQTLKDRKDLNIDFESIGVLGCSWGGMSAAVLVDRHPQIKAMASLDGTETHYFGESEQDDDYLNEIYNADLIHPEQTESTYLYMESGNKIAEFVPTAEYHYFKKTAPPKYYLRFIDSKHEDFLCIPSILNISERAVNTHAIIKENTLLFFNRYLKGETGFRTYYETLLANDRITEKPFIISYEAAEKFILSGEILDKKTNAPIPYVNIGVLNKEQGTVSAQNGAFKLDLNKNFSDDTIRISAIGYKSRNFPVRDLLRQKGNVQVKLEDEISELEEIIVTARSLKSKILGNKTKSKFLGTGFYYDQLGAEMGLKINVKRNPTYLDTFNFHISYNRLSANSLFRLNIYSVVKGKPFENILRQNIIVPIKAKQTGLVSVDLKEYDIVLKEDVIVTLEWIATEGDVKKGEGIFFSLSLLTAGTYVRYSSQGKLKKKRGLGVGFNINVRY